MSAPSTFEKIRDNLAARFGWLDGRHSRVLDIVADIHMSIHNRTRGLASIVCGQHRPRHWRAILLGEDPLYLTDLVRLALSDRREAQEAVDEALEILAEARGYVLVPVGEKPAPIEAATREMVTAACRLGGSASAALEDGRVTQAELERIADDANVIAEKVNSWKAARRDKS